MRKRFAIAAAGVSAVAALAGGTYAVAGGGGLIFDDGAYVKPGSLDDGKELLPQTTISLAQAVSSARAAVSGQLGQVDLERLGNRVVYSVDVGEREVKVDAADGSVVSIDPQS